MRVRFNGGQVSASLAATQEPPTMSASPAPALLPLPRSLRTPRRSAPREVAMEAPGDDRQVSIELLLARVTIRGVAGVSSAAVAEYVAILQRDLAGAARLARLNAPTLPAPASIDDALESVLDDSMHDPSTCTDPCCVDDSDDDDVHAYCADEGHVVLSDARGFYGVSSGGAW